MSAVIDNLSIFDAISDISRSNSESEVKAMTKFVIREVGGDCFIYSTLRANQSHQYFDLIHYFEDCQARWREKYNERKWFMNDPLIEYAKANTEPIVSSKIECKSRGQVDLLATAASCGFRSGIVAPAHCSLGAHEWLGILFVGSSSEPDSGEPLLISNRVIFRALSLELMDWWRNYFKKEAMRKHNIHVQDIQILEYLKNGKDTHEISAMLDVKKSAIYSRITTLKDKLNVKRTNDAIQRAKTFGLLG